MTTRQDVQITSILEKLDIDLIKLKHDYETQGYVIMDGIFAEQDLKALQKAAHEVVQLTRQGNWPHRRIVGKQFPPFDKVQSNDSWGVQHLMHPDLPNHTLFTKFYASSPLLDVACFLLGVQDEQQLQLELFNLLIEPEKHSFALGWHRDDVRADVTQEEEKTRLAAPTHGIQWNACLYDDDCLFVVPGTHTRIRDEAERKANAEIPPAAKPFKGEDDSGFDGDWEIDPPTTLRVRLKAGQTAFYSQRILHRASYLPSRHRATLHGCYGEVGYANSQDEHSTSASERARNVLQHGVEWMKEDAFGQQLPERLKPMWKNLLVMSEKNRPEDLGYSLDG
ncbi:uncharacterized protein FA14DRAFT_161986 [Meira miltonrushii]|uniref:Phytanoyl-CoA dioxygenase family protein n=1 Tax=Meira miltonrushii TaxID=1280837 RepID=A0A316V4Z8_9BASI|nr:uncharacterized protein FA14DRAFT_161986 [Meira miltonrushii]PWN32637.1 hypothetical protein FA14DRAFT_161986 [Meira miltonrushii]